MARSRRNRSKGLDPMYRPAIQRMLGRVTYVEFLEWTPQDFQRFKKAPPIAVEKVQQVDVDQLCARLSQPMENVQ